MDNPQRYRLHFEFDLRDRSDYTVVVELIRQHLAQVEELMKGQMYSDYLAFEKVETK